jgi:hypothetical protein
MYARVARFEGIDSSRIDDQIAEMRKQMTASRNGDMPEGTPEGVKTLMDTVTRFVQLVDGDNGIGIGISFAENEEDIRRADEALNEMSPGEGEGRRAGSAEIYEVMLDETFR